MNTENTQKTQQEQNSKEELIFIDKEKSCDTCDDEKEVELAFGLSTKTEWDNVMKLTTKYGLSREEINYIYGFYNREFKEKKSPGCGKCFFNICKNLEKRYKTLINQHNIT